VLLRHAAVITAADQPHIGLLDTCYSALTTFLSFAEAQHNTACQKSKITLLDNGTVLLVAVRLLQKKNARLPNDTQTASE